jgi:hypothetical protein
VLSIDFNDLPEVTKHRFVSATRSPAARIAFYSASSGSTGWALLLLAAALPLVLVLLSAVGQAADGGKRQGMGLVVVILPLAFFVALGALGIARSSAVGRAHPYYLGTYLFPTQIVVAKSKILALHPFAELIDVHVLHRYVNGGYRCTDFTCSFKTGPAVTWEVSSLQEAARVKAALAQGHRTLLTALANRDFEALRPIDPFFEAQMTSFAKVNAPGPSIQALPKWSGAGPRLLIAAGSSLLLTGLTVLVCVVVAAVTSSSDAVAAASASGPASSPARPPPRPTVDPLAPPPATPTPAALPATPAARPAPSAKKKPGMR